MTETDLITAGGNSENVELPQSQTVNSDISSSQDRSEADAANGTSTAETAPTAGDRPAALSTMVLPELRALAKEIGVAGASGMRKSELIAAIRERRAESNGRPQASAGSDANDTAKPSTDTATEAGTTEQTAEDQTPPRRERRGASRGAGAAGGSDQNKQETDQQNKAGTESERPAKQDTKSDGGDQQGEQGGQNRGGSAGDDDGEGRGGRRGRRFRDRRRRERGGGEGGGADTELREDDVVQPVAGILDVLDNYAFVRTSGYLAGPNDVYVSMNMVRKNGLRRGDAVTGAVRVPKDGEQPNQRQKFNPLVRLDTVNGKPVEEAKKRPEFTKLTPLYPNTRLRLETTSEKLTTRVIDLIMPVGKGQRALIVSPPKAGKTTILQDIANAITRNNPECHLMVVLVDERPEEVTDMQRLSLIHI